MRDEMYGFVTINGIEELSEGQECYRYHNEPLVVCEVSPQTMEMLEGQEAQEAGQQLLTKMECDYLLLVATWQVEIRLMFLSSNKRVRAPEFLDALVAEYGLVKGDGLYASARVAAAILQAQISDMELSGIMEYFLKMANAYFTECDWIDAKQYFLEQNNSITRFELYQKRRVAWAYVKTTDIVSAGRKLLIKSLENESGNEITADEKLYIMIGCRGEIYYIEKNKFESTYEVTEDMLDIFQQMLDFLPEVETIPDGKYISLDEMAHLCFPKQGNSIYAKQLDRRTKVFPEDSEGDYFLGRPGDYMAVREDDLSDIYIIRRDIFGQTYELINSGD